MLLKPIRPYTLLVAHPALFVLSFVLHLLPFLSFSVCFSLFLRMPLSASLSFSPSHLNMESK